MSSDVHMRWHPRGQGTPEDARIHVPLVDMSSDSTKRQLLRELSEQKPFSRLLVGDTRDFAARAYIRQLPDLPDQGGGKRALMSMRSDMSIDIENLLHDSYRLTDERVAIFMDESCSLFVRGPDAGRRASKFTAVGMDVDGDRYELRIFKPPRSGTLLWRLARTRVFLRWMCLFWMEQTSHLMGVVNGEEGSTRKRDRLEFEHDREA